MHTRHVSNGNLPVFKNIQLFLSRDCKSVACLPSHRLAVDSQRVRLASEEPSAFAFAVQQLTSSVFAVQLAFDQTLAASAAQPGFAVVAESFAV